MHNKIKEIRIKFGLSEAQVSSMLNISSYKYRKFENGDLLFSVESVLMLSIMWDLPIDLLIYEKFSIDDIIKNNSVEKVLLLSDEEKLAFCVTNIKKQCTFNCNAVNYRVVRNIFVKYLKTFSRNLYNFRCSKAVEISEIALSLQIDLKHYIELENGRIWPTIHELVSISSFFMKSINELLGKSEEDL